MRVRFSVIGVWASLLAWGMVQAAHGAIAIDQITNIDGGGLGFNGVVNVFASAAGAPFQVDDTAVFMNNDIIVYTMDGPSAGDGAGFSISISNGENGITSSDGGANTDIDNAEPAHPVFAAIGNASGRLENGNAIRFSMWMRQDPNDPVMVEPQIEPVVKIELWKEALSGFADFSGSAFPGFGDRVWDTDQNAGNSIYDGTGQSRASWVDVDNNGSIAVGAPVAESLVTSEWRLVETVLVIDDDPLDDLFGWRIGSEQFPVSTIEEVRAVMFVGDFAGTDLTAGGSFWVDNLVLEVFANEADMLATPNPNTAPIELSCIAGDFNCNGAVENADLTLLLNNWGAPVPPTPDGWTGPEPTAPAIDNDELTALLNNWGNVAPGGASVSGSAVPEPATWCLLVFGVVGIISRRAIARHP